MVFFVLFYQRSPPVFSYPDEILHSLFWRIPAFILLLLLLDKKPLFRPKKDLIVLSITLPALCITGFLVSLAAGLSGFSPPEEIAPPDSVSAWISVILLSLSTGCLEETYFRAYLPGRILELKQVHTAGSTENTTRSITAAFFTSAIVFSLCHAYEGPWGFVNALLASFVLSIAYIKSSSLSGITLAHGLYNIFVYITAALKQQVWGSLS